MPVPIDYKQASTDFDRFMLDARDTLDLQTTHQAWGVLLGVFDTFRRRLSTEQALGFAKALPPLVRAAFVQDLHFGIKTAEFGDRDQMDAEVMAYHRDHQLAQPGSIAGIASVLRRHVDNRQFDAALKTMPVGAEAFWWSGSTSD